MSRNFSVRGRKKYVKHASDLHAKKEEWYENWSRRRAGNRLVGLSVCQEISDTVFADTRNASLVTTIDERSLEGRIFSGFLAQEVRRIVHMRYYVDARYVGVVGTRKIYSARNKILVKPLRRSVTRLYAPSIRQFRGIFNWFDRHTRAFHYSLE